MDRRKFIKNTFASAATASILPTAVACQEKETRPVFKSNKLLSSYYFRAHMYTMVPHQVREDMKWMADHGTDIVCPAIIEQDLFAAVENMDIIANEAAKEGMKVHLVPSRWAGLIAGSPKVPSLFSVTNPQTWILNKEGKPYHSSVSGVFSSIFYPETVNFFKESLDKIIELWDAQGFIWDEPKIFSKVDYSPKAVEAMGEPTLDLCQQAFIDFWSEINLHIKSKNPDMVNSMFLFAHVNDELINKAAKIKGLDYFGCDGRPWHNDDPGQNESNSKGKHRKTLLGSGERFIKAAHDNKKGSLMLIENHNMLDKDVVIMEQRFPELIQKDIDYLMYYYYPRNIENPEKNMGVVGKYIKEFKM